MKNNKRFSSWLWGTFMLLIAALILGNQLGGFTDLSLVGITVAALAVVFIVQCLLSANIAPVPFPLAALYIIFQETLDLPEIQIWALLFVALFTTIGLVIILPQKRLKNPFSSEGYIAGEGYVRQEGVENDDDYPHIDAKLTSANRYLRSDCFAGGHFSCNLGELNVYFDNVTLSPNGAVVHLDCNLGAINLYVPKTWNVVDNIRCSLGAVEMHNRHAPEKDAPRLVLEGSVSLAGIEITFI